jgi:hypothetical protein
MGPGVVGPCVHPYEPSRQPYQTPIPAMRPSQDPAGNRSATPIYDALYSEYRRSFRTLPGDRTNEENTGFTAFGTGMHGTGLHGTGMHSTGMHGGGMHSGGGQRPPENPGSWQRQHNGGHARPALPPGPRRGL